jgi:hypothetical protein
MNNPRGLPALDPSVPGSAGARLLQIVSTVRDVRRDEWFLRTQRHNLLPHEVLPRDYRSQARVMGGWLAPKIAGRTVLLLGSDVAEAVGHDAPPMVWSGRHDWIQIPHPSGKNLFYNDPVARLAVSVLVHELMDGLSSRASPRIMDPVEREEATT